MEKIHVLIILALLVALCPYTVTPSASQTGSALPSITSGISEIVAANIGPIVPAIVAPGDGYTIELRQEYSSLTVSSAHMWTVKPVGDKLTIYNYTLSISSTGPGVYSVTIPREAEEGLYDLLLVANSAEHVVPRSIWVVKSWPSVLRFMENTDLHFITGPPTIADQRDPFAGDVNRFAAFTIDNIFSPLFILWLGDETDTDATKEYVMTLAYRYAYLYNIPVLGIPGNHDYPRWWKKSTAGDVSYTKYLGPVKWYRILAGRLLVMGLSTEREGYLPWDGLVFAERVLQERSDMPYKVILVHHPPFFYQGEIYTRYDDEKVLRPHALGGPISGSWSNNMTALRYFLKLVEDYNVTVVLSGHMHRDYFTKYVSTRTNTTTLFLTFTTAAKEAASYDGLSLMELDLETGQLEFPLKPPTFIGFQNSTPLALNSIPIGVYPGRNNFGWSNLTFTYMNVIYSKDAYTFRFENNNVSWINFNGPLIWSLPWNGSSVGFKKLEESGASIEVIDHKIIGGRLFLLVDVKLPYQGRASLAVYSMLDHEPPTVSLRKIIPEKPKVDEPTTIYVDIRDDAWGVNPYSLLVKLNETVVAYSSIPMDNTFSIINPATYTERFNNVSLVITVKIRSSSTVTLPLVIQVSDNAGNSASHSFNITFATGIAVFWYVLIAVMLLLAVIVVLLALRRTRR